MRRCAEWLTVFAAFLTVAVAGPAGAAQWTFETLDGSGGGNGRVDADVGGLPSGTTATTIYAGQPHAWYPDVTNGDLRHAWWNGAQWTFETLDGAGGGNGRTSHTVGEYAAATIYAGQPHVWYDDFTAADLRHAWWNGVEWNFETLDGAGGGNGRTTDSVGGVQRGDDLRRPTARLVPRLQRG